MKKACALLLLVMLGFGTAVSATAPAVSVRTASAKLVETEPGKIITCSFLAANQTLKAELFWEKLELPPGWQLLIPTSSPFTLKAGEQQLRLMAFMVPGNCPAGRFTLKYTLTSQRDYGLSAQDYLEVEVLPVIKLEAVVEKKPDVVIAGDTYRVAVRLANRGNGLTQTRMEVRSIPEYPVSVSPELQSLDPGKAQLVTLEVKTDRNTTQRSNHILEISAVETKALKRPPVSVALSVATEIIPRSSGQVDPFLRLPARIRVVSAGDNGAYAGQVEFSGAGKLDEEGKRWLNFLVRTPDIQNISSFGERDEYRLTYQQPGVSLYLGDRGYSLSPLVELYKYGRGAELNLNRGKLGVGTYYMHSRWVDPEQKECAAFINYLLSPACRLKGNFLNKASAGNEDFIAHHDNLYSLQTFITPVKNSKLELEYSLNRSESSGASLSDKAYHIKADGTYRDAVNYYFEKIFAGPDYTGYYNDSSYTWATLAFPLSRRFRCNFNYRDYANNLNFLTQTQFANLEQYFSGGLQYLADMGLNLSLDYETYQRKDVLDPPDYDYAEKDLKLGVGRTLGKLTFQTYLEKGNFYDAVSNLTNNDVQRLSLYLFYNPDMRQSYSVYTQNGYSRYSQELQYIKSAGVSAHIQLQNNLRFSLNLERNNYLPPQERLQDNLFSTLIYTLPNKQSLDLTARWYQEHISQTSQTSIRLGYNIPWDIPVGRKKAFGILTGKVYDQDQPGQPGRPRVILNAMGTPAVTNEKGEFRFPYLKSGKVNLWVESSSLGDRVTSQKFPLTIDIPGGQTQTVDIPLVTPAQLSGKVGIYSFEPASLLLGGTPKLQPAGGLSGVILELYCQDESFKQITDTDGSFNFSGLRPGSWKLKIYSDHLPAQHYLEQEEFEVLLTAGGKQEIIARVLPRFRPIKIIEQGQIKR